MNKKKKSNHRSMGRLAAGVLLAVCMLAVVVTGGIAELNQKQMPEGAVFSWYPDYETPDYMASLETVFETFRITAVYQYVDTGNLGSERLLTFANDLREKQIDLYLIYDEQDLDRNSFDAYLREVAAYRDELGIRGIVTDVEPLSDETPAHDAEADSTQGKQLILARYAGFLAYCDTAAAAFGLDVLNCIPTWYDMISETMCDAIISSGDGIVLMNYNREHRIDGISYEVGAAIREGVQVISAMELGRFEETTGVTPETSYYGEDVETIQSAVRDVAQVYPETVAGYHQLRDLLELMQ